MAAPHLSVKPSLKHSISLQLRQSLQLLAFTQTELREHLQKLLEENPFLEEIENTSTPASLSYESAGKPEFWEEKIEESLSLQDSLQKQISFLNIPSRLKDLVEHIISSLDANGFVHKSHELLASEIGYGRLDAKRAIEFLKKLEPLGISAVDSWQAMLWQAQVLHPHDKVLPDIIQVLEQAQGDALRLNFTSRRQLSEALLLPIDLIEEKINILQSLQPFPAAVFSSANENKAYVVPDIVYRQNEQGRIEILLEGYLLPSLRVNHELYQKDTRKQMSTVWKEKFNEAENLLRTLNYRESSLRRLAEFILEKQQNFFYKGNSYLRPLNLAEAATALEVSVSTVSRLAAQKYCQSPWGVFPLKKFFPSYIKSSDDQVRGQDDLQNSILAIVVGESKPLSDREITELLQQQGFDVQRRTVSKYRKLLHIPSAFHRRV